MFSLENLVEEVITVVSQVYELHYPDKSILLNISKTIWLSGLWSKEQKYVFFQKLETLMDKIRIIVVEI